jgi:4-amino-4-deoxy-L-arabinose transferase-like glycosyltransferase
MRIIDREWREAADLQPSRAGLALALGGAAVLRLWALGSGIPYMTGVDEPEVMDRAVRIIKTGDFNPHFFDYPSLYIYVQAAVGVVRFLAGAIWGQWSSLAQFGASDVYLWGRAVTAVAGIATVWVLYLAGLRWGARTAVLAAALLAVMPLHVRESHYVLTDVPMTLLVTLAFLLSLRAHERERVGAFALAGAAAGLAAATKYNGAIALVMPLIACGMTPAVRPSRLVASLATLGAFLGASLIAAPYTLLDLPGFLNGFAHLATMYRDPANTVAAPAVTYLKHLRNAWHWPATLLAAAGLALGATRAIKGPGRVKWTLAIVFPAVYFWFISHQTIVYGRYLLPIVPPLALLAAGAVVSGVSQLRRYQIPRSARNASIAALVLLAIVPPAYSAITFDAMIARTWTTKQAYDFVLAQIPAGSRVTIETRELRLPDSYRTDHVRQLRDKPLEAYAAGGVNYLVASSQCYGPFLSEPARYPREYADYMRLFREAPELARFTPSRDHPGPELRILQVAP